MEKTLYCRYKTKQQVQLINKVTIMTKFANLSVSVSVESYNYVAEMARLFSNNRIESLYYEYLINEGLEGLQKAIDTYEGECKGAKFVTYMHRVIKNHLINEKERYLRHKLNIQEPTYKGGGDDDNMSDDEKIAKAMCNGFNMLNDEDCTEGNDFEGGAPTRITDENEVRMFKRLLLRASNGNERNARIVEKVIGFQCEPMELKEIAKEFGLSHESVRLAYTKAVKALRADKRAVAFLCEYIG